MKPVMQFEVVSWKHVYELSMQLSNRIAYDNFNPDMIVGISRGGLVPLRIISDILDNPEIANIRVKFYSDINEKMRGPIITQPISTSVTGKCILIVDDITDTGQSLCLVSEKLGTEAKNVKTLTLYHKPWSSFTPNYFAKETESWVIFPWEICETVKRLGNKMIRKGHNLEEVKAGLIRIGLDPSIVGILIKDLWKERNDED